MEPDWPTLITKHSDGIDLDTATKEELEEYVKTKIHVHTEADFTDYTLWAIFQEEFEAFTTDDFKKLRTDTRARLCTYLL
jgi:hypothetical protein